MNKKVKNSLLSHNELGKLLTNFILVINWYIRAKLRLKSNIYDRTFCKNSYRREGVNYFFKRLVLDVSPSSQYVCVCDNYFCFVLTFNFVSGMVQPEY